MATYARHARKILGFTQVQMAKACNTAVGTVAKWDQGQRQPTGQAIRLIDTMLWLKSRGEFENWMRIFTIEQPTDEKENYDTFTTKT